TAFNRLSMDNVTAHIPPLSLHDALPIFKRTMWSRRAQEYEAKIDSGDLVSIAEVVRDLHRAGGQPEQSYSERQLYEKALARMARDRKSTRLNSSHVKISYAVFCLKKKIK